MDKLDLSKFFFYPYIFENYRDTYKVYREFSIESLPKEFSVPLQQNEGVPSHHTFSKAFNSTGHLVEASEIWSAADYFKFKVEVDL